MELEQAWKCSNVCIPYVDRFKKGMDGKVRCVAGEMMYTAHFARSDKGNALRALNSGPSKQ